MFVMGGGMSGLEGKRNMREEKGKVQILSVDRYLMYLQDSIVSMPSVHCTVQTYGYKCLGKLEYPD